MKQTRHWFYTAVSLTAAFFSMLYLVGAAWIPIKAELAQWLIERNWQEALEGNVTTRPWPWADTRAVGVLSVPGLDRISLMTCYPFDALRSGGPLRYVVTALPVAGLAGSGTAKLNGPGR